jgi:hypothetical protein
MCRNLDRSQKLVASGQEADTKKDTDVTSGVTECSGHWIEIYLLDEERQPIKGARCVVVTSDGITHGDYTNKAGKVRFPKIAAGKAQVMFPELDKSSLEEVIEIDKI